MKLKQNMMTISFLQSLVSMLKMKIVNNNQFRKIANATIILLLIFNSLTLVHADPEQSLIGDYLSDDNSTSEVIKLAVVLTVLTLLPSILMTITVFPRIVIVLSFTRSAIGTQQTPPNQVLIGIALILTFFIMSPIITEVKTDAYDPYMAGEINTEEAFTLAMEPMREFMFEKAKTEPETINFYLNLSGITDMPESLEGMPTLVIIMSFITSELKKAFIMGFIIYVPFIIIDMMTASVLMSMGMMMIPPTTISLPFKILLFIIVDGWTLLFKTLVSSFG